MLCWPGAWMERPRFKWTHKWDEWDWVPKKVFVGPDTLELGVNDAVSHFNIGSQAAINTFTNIGIEPGEFCLEEIKKRGH